MRFDLRPWRTRFYAERDKRTRFEAAGASIEAFRSELVLSPETVDTYATQTTALLGVNVLSRFCRDLRIVCPMVPAHASLRAHPHVGGATLPVALKRLARAIDPYIRVKVTAEPSREERHRILINSPSPEQGAFNVYPREWDLTLGISVPRAPPMAEGAPNPLAPAFAAFLAGADAFKVASGAHMGTRTVNQTLDLWSLDGRPSAPRPPPLNQLDLGRSLLLGVGGVGASFCHLLSLGRFRGSMVLVDHDRVAFSNLNRCLPFLFVHAKAKGFKVEVCRDVVAHAGMGVSTHALKAADFFDERPRQPGEYDQVFAVANEDGAYRFVQSNYPPTVLHASTSPNWQVNAGWHEPFADPCVVCELGGTEVATFKCEDGVEAKPAGPERRLGSLPFLAPMAGAMLLRTTMRRALGAAQGATIQSLNLATPEPRFTSRRALDIESCICRHQDRQLHQQFLQAA